MVADLSFIEVGGRCGVARSGGSGRFRAKGLLDDAQLHGESVKLAEAMDCVIPVLLWCIDSVRKHGDSESAISFSTSFKALMSLRLGLAKAASNDGVTLPMSDEVRELFADMAAISQAKAREELARLTRSKRKAKRRAA